MYIWNFYVKPETCSIKTSVRLTGDITKTRTQQLIGKLLYKKKSRLGKKFKSLASKDRFEGLRILLQNLVHEEEPNTQSLGPIGANLHGDNFDFEVIRDCFEFCLGTQSEKTSENYHYKHLNSPNMSPQKIHRHLTRQICEHMQNS